MIDTDAGDQRHVGIHHIDRIQPAAQAHSSTTASSCDWLNSQNAARVPISK
jgi:hypothetical protein